MECHHLIHHKIDFTNYNITFLKLHLGIIMTRIAFIKTEDNYYIDVQRNFLNVGFTLIL